MEIMASVIVSPVSNTASLRACEDESGETMTEAGIIERFFYKSTLLDAQRCELSNFFNKNSGFW